MAGRPRRTTNLIKIIQKEIIQMGWFKPTKKQLKAEIKQLKHQLQNLTDKTALAEKAMKIIEIDGFVPIGKALIDQPLLDYYKTVEIYWIHQSDKNPKGHVDIETGENTGGQYNHNFSVCPECGKLFKRGEKVLKCDICNEFVRVVPAAEEAKIFASKADLKEGAKFHRRAYVRKMPHTSFSPKEFVLKPIKGCTKADK